MTCLRGRAAMPVAKPPQNEEEVASAQQAITESTAPGPLCRLHRPSPLASAATLLDFGSLPLCSLVRAYRIVS